MTNRGMALIYAAAERNKSAIIDALTKILPVTPTTLLEIASGSGQHSAAIATAFPHCIIQPTEYDAKLLESIDEFIENVNRAIQFDVSQKDISVENGKVFDYMFCANMIHISSNAAVEGLFSLAGKYARNALITYGPYSVDGVISPESNISFDKSLRSQNPEWGYRDTTELVVIAKENGLVLEDIVAMPANNHFIVWKKL